MRRLILALSLIAAGPLTTPVEAAGRGILVAAAPQGSPAKAEGEGEKEPSLEEKMRRRFPQPIRVGDLIGLPVLDWRDRTIGYIADVVRTPDGKIELVVPYRPWLGWLSGSAILDWGRRPVAVPLEAAAILGRQVAALDMSWEQFDTAPAFTASEAAPLSRDDTIKIAITRR